jgi:hypothetical protein
MKHIIINDGFVYRVSNKLAKEVENVVGECAKSVSENLDEVRHIVAKIEKEGKYLFTISTNIRILSNKKVKRKIHFRQGDEKVLFTVTSISTDKRIYYLIDSSFVDKDMLYASGDKSEDFIAMLEDTLPDSKEWRDGIDYSFELFDKQHKD